MTNDNDTTNAIPVQSELPFAVTIPLTRGYSTVVDAIDADLKSYNWQVQIAPRSKYATRMKGGRLNPQREFIHRIILGRVLGRAMLKDEHVDHIDGDGLNNCRSNLRLANNTQNQHNARINAKNTSGFKGVTWNKLAKKWKVSITFEGKRKHLGYYTTPEAAHEAYCIAAKELYGEFARFE